MVQPKVYADMDATWERLYVFQPYRSQGSLRDRIYDVRHAHADSFRECRRLRPGPTSSGAVGRWRPLALPARAATVPDPLRAFRAVMSTWRVTGAA